ncbi:pheromone-processing carboxypeptidase KEX1-like [Trichoplusia ni]|uniref:Pheromone-processing carboxypeptidase KEX1-like n=1 Tax=Trichoplusia ni TaxID=7111 RepID=A0A7E5WRY6_TRINI|nr:pheromone-processing carboxypeptidase KEX1-like [Trichoplusia ni]
MDFQKVGEAIFNNEKYNILKPTTHIVSDYFKDFMLRRENTDIPTKRVFVDKNGFRHFWSGFGSASKSLRKTDVRRNIKAGIKKQFLRGGDDTEQPEGDTTTVKIEVATTVEATDETKIKVLKEGEDPEKKDTDDKGSDKKDSDKKESDDKDTEKKDSDNKDAEKKESDDKDKKESDDKDSGKKESDDKDSDKKDADKKDAEDKDAGKKDTEKKENGDETTTTKKISTKSTTPKPADRVVAKTTFFCPFFGVITMAAFLD